MPGSSEPMSSRRSTAAPPRVASRSASRAVIASPPSRPRATSSACFTSANRSLRSFDAEPSTPSPTRTPAPTSCRTGATPAPSLRFDVGQCATPVPVAAKRATSPFERWTQCAHHVVVEPAEPVEVLDWRAPVQLAAVRLLLDSLRQVRVENEPETARECGGLLHQASRDRERRARRDRDLDASAWSRLVQRGVEPLRLGEDGVDPLDQLVGRQSSVRHPEVHRAARRHQPHPELAGRLHFGLEDPGAPAREHVVVVEDGRAPGERELCEPGARGGIFRLCVDSRPDRIELAQPREQVGLLRPGARQRLVQVVVGIDEPWGEHCAAEIDATRVLRLGAAADSGDELALDEHPALLVLRAGVVHRHDPPVCVERTTGTLSRCSIVRRCDGDGRPAPRPRLGARRGQRGAAPAHPALRDSCARAGG